MKHYLIIQRPIGRKQRWMASFVVVSPLLPSKAEALRRYIAGVPQTAELRNDYMAPKVEEVMYGKVIRV